MTRSLLPCMVLIALVGCNKAPEGGAVAIGPDAPTTSSDLMLTISEQAVDPNKNDEIEYQIAWTVDGTVRSDLTGETIPADQT
ncbi:MAG: hypothetical protein AB8H79_18235, partial [Myxococcota bacterium]